MSGGEGDPKSPPKGVRRAKRKGERDAEIGASQNPTSPAPSSLAEDRAAEPALADSDRGEIATDDLASDAAEGLRMLRPPPPAPVTPLSGAASGISLVDIGAAPAMRSTTVKVELPPEAREELRRALQRRSADDEDTLVDMPRPDDEVTPVEGLVEDDDGTSDLGDVSLKIRPKKDP